MVPGLAVVLGLAVIFGLAVVLLLAVLGFQCPELFAGLFPRDFSGLDGLDDLLVGLGELVVAALAVVFGMLLGLAVVLLLAALGFHCLELFDGIFP